MPRYKLTIEYDGTPYRGWQRQDGLSTVQQALEDAMAEFARHPVTVFAAGRTDTGVHGLGQIVHVDLEAEWPPWKIAEATNGLLRLSNHPVAVLEAERVGDEFDARFSANKRHYRYRIINRPANLTVDLGGPGTSRNRWMSCAWTRQPRCFSAIMISPPSAPPSVRQKTLCAPSISWMSCASIDQEIEILCASRAFLHNQVRSLAGSLKLVGEGKWDRQDLKAALDAKDRKACGPVAPACGLYFESVDY